jgi:hypothetical protein
MTPPFRPIPAASACRVSDREAYAEIHKQSLNVPDDEDYRSSRVLGTGRMPIERWGISRPGAGHRATPRPIVPVRIRGTSAAAGAYEDLIPLKALMSPFVDESCESTGSPP